MFKNSIKDFSVESFSEPLLLDPLFPPHPLPEGEVAKLDLENSIVMQELTAAREERAELRVKVGFFPYLRVKIG